MDEVAVFFFFFFKDRTFIIELLNCCTMQIWKGNTSVT